MPCGAPIGYKRKIAITGGRRKGIFGGRTNATQNGAQAIPMKSRYKALGVPKTPVFILQTTKMRPMKPRRHVARETMSRNARLRKTGCNVSTERSPSLKDSAASGVPQANTFERIHRGPRNVIDRSPPRVPARALERRVNPRAIGSELKPASAPAAHDTILSAVTPDPPGLLEAPEVIRRELSTDAQDFGDRCGLRALHPPQREQDAKADVAVLPMTRV